MKNINKYSFLKSSFAILCIAILSIVFSSCNNCKHKDAACCKPSVDTTSDQSIAPADGQTGFSFVGTVIELANPAVFVTNSKFSVTNRNGTFLSNQAVVGDNATINFPLDEALIPFTITVMPNDLTKYAPSVIIYRGGTMGYTSYGYYFKLKAATLAASTLTVNIRDKSTDDPIEKWIVVKDKLTNVVVLAKTKSSSVTCNVTMGKQYLVYVYDNGVTTTTSARDQVSAPILSKNYTQEIYFYY